MSDVITKTRTNGAARIYAIPALLALVSSIGLVAALVFDGLMDSLSGVAIALPLIAAAWRIGQSWLMFRRGDCG